MTTIELLFIGIFFIMCGIVIKTKKWLWIHQGLIDRPVDVDKYTNYMGNIDINMGIIFIIVGFILYFINISQVVIVVIIITYSASIIYGEVKYRTKRE